MTGLTGLAVDAQPHHTLSVLYGKILRCLQKMPPDASYRKYTEQTITERFNHVKTVCMKFLCAELLRIVEKLKEKADIKNINIAANSITFYLFIYLFIVINQILFFL